MKKLKIFILVAILVAATFCLSSCGNYQVFDTVYNYNRAIISLPNGAVVEGKVQTWADYENSDQIQVRVDDTYYLVHSTNVVLMAE